jgi:hypothetical protein
MTFSVRTHDNARVTMKATREHFEERIARYRENSKAMQKRSRE